MTVQPGLGPRSAASGRSGRGGGIRWAMAGCRRSAPPQLRGATTVDFGRDRLPCRAWVASSSGLRRSRRRCLSRRPRSRRTGAGFRIPQARPGPTRGATARTTPRRRRRRSASAPPAATHSRCAGRLRAGQRARRQRHRPVPGDGRGPRQHELVEQRAAPVRSRSSASRPHPCGNSLASVYYNLIWGTRRPTLAEPLLRGTSWSTTGGSQNDVASSSSYLGHADDHASPRSRTPCARPRCSPS